jgi:DNA polymerase sigma
VKALANILKNAGMTRVQAITTAKVPICKFTEPETGISCDINTSNVLGVINSDFLKVYVDICPIIRPVVLIVKHWASSRGINDSAYGGIVHLQTNFQELVPMH